ncbi:MAG: helix-turn-helix transcriptional regulator [Pseudomonadota bacterium]
MTHEKYLGEFEVIVLAAVLRLGDAAYGISIIDEIKERTGRSVSIGALYATLSRLEDKKYVSARTGEATAARGGRAKRYFSITHNGRLQLNRSIALFNSMLSDLPGWAVGEPI